MTRIEVLCLREDEYAEAESLSSSFNSLRTLVSLRQLSAIHCTRIERMTLVTECVSDAIRLLRPSHRHVAIVAKRYDEISTGRVDGLAVNNVVSLSLWVDVGPISPECDDVLDGFTSLVRLHLSRPDRIAILGHLSERNSRRLPRLRTLELDPYEAYIGFNKVYIPVSVTCLRLGPLADLWVSLHTLTELLANLKPGSKLATIHVQAKLAEQKSVPTEDYEELQDKCERRGITIKYDWTRSSRTR